MPAPADDRERGIALLFVLWVLTLLALVVVGFAHETGTRALLARNDYDHARARALADAGLSLALLGLLDRPHDPALRLDGSVRELAMNGGTIRLRLQDEAGKIDLNYAPGIVLANLLRIAAGEDGEAAVRLADAIARWQRQRLAEWRGPNGASLPPLGPFLAVDELRGVPGITGRIYRAIAPFVTVWTHSAGVDPISAPREVLLSLPGADPRQVDAYLALRDRYGGAAGSLPGLPGSAAYLTTMGAGINITITADALAAPAGRFVRDATVSLIAAAGQPFRFLAWQEDRGDGEAP